MDAPETKRLLSLAASVSEGAPIDWQAEEASLDSHETAVARELQVLDQIASFHRSNDPADAPDAKRRDNRADSKADPLPRAWGHFTIVEQVGVGAFGTVYRAVDTKLQAEVALKLLRRLGPDNPSPSRVLKEGRLLARVHHPNVARVYGIDEIDGRVGLWMEFVNGRTLADLLLTQGPFNAREAALVGIDLCRALAAVHKAGLVHGDVKAHNVMREDGGRTVLMDFGTGKDLMAQLALAGSAAAGDFAGTPLYLAPEVFDGQPRTTAADIYSLGVLLYHLVTNAYPINGRNRAEVEQAHRGGAQSHLRDARPDLPEEFIRTVERALAGNPRERYQTTGAFEAALAKFLGAVPEPSTNRQPGLWLIAASIGMIGLLTLGIYWAGFRSSGASGSQQARATDFATAGAAPASLASAASASDQSYQIEAAMYRAAAAQAAGQTGQRGRDARLSSGTRIAPGDALFLDIRLSAPAYVYVVNEDEHGESYLLFPLPGQSVENPLPSGRTNRLPGPQAGEDINWQVTSAGGREHFLVFASPERLPVFEQVFATLPRAEAGRPIQNARLSPEAVSTLRSVGGLVSAPRQSLSDSSLSRQFTTPLRDTEETARGLWVRQLTLENPLR
jgi:serine/threonine-protein kinase